MCWLSLSFLKPHALGADAECLMCAFARSKDAAHHNAAVASGIQRPAETRKAVSA